MIIGLDFDNTIVSYDEVFHAVAMEQLTLPSDIPVNKLAVRNYLRGIGKEDLWTEMQGYVYGKRMHEAAAYPGVIDFIKKAVEAGNTIIIVSHKTRYPYAGPKYDLHESAKAWVDRNLSDNHGSLANAFFEETKEQKFGRISEQACDLFVDDLPEILLSEQFPQKTKRILFDPQQFYAGDETMGLITFSSWHELAKGLSL